MPSYKLLRRSWNKVPTVFDEGSDKMKLMANFAKDNRTSIPIKNDNPTYDDLQIGVKVFDERLKQKN